MSGKAFPFLLVFLVPFSVLIGWSLGGAWTFLTPLFVFGVVPLVDHAIGVAKANPSPEEEQALARARFFRYVNWACAPVQVCMVIWAAWTATRGSASFLELSGLVLSVGICSGVIGINAAHELVHRIDNSFEPLLGRLMLATTAYAHWASEHVKGHHRNVATPEDPATARLGESFYAFLPRTVIGGLKSAWRIESSLALRRKKRPWSVSNPVVAWAAFEVLFGIGLWAFWGFGALVFYLAQALVAVCLLEAVNYLEHYGLERKRAPSGQYERVTPVHSWNADQWLTNRFLFNLQRHSDHHANPQRRYQLLRRFEESPQLPTGYAGMVPVALVPRLWRRVMDRRVAEYRSWGAQSR
jgi:alkane 1-monooxygenase